MRKALYWCTSFLFFMLHAQAQESYIDTLKHELTAAKEDIVKLWLLFDISDAYKNKKLDSMVYYAQRCVLLSSKNENQFPDSTQVQALSYLAYTLWYAGNYPDAKGAYFKALEKAEPLGDTMLIASIYNGLAMVNRNEGDFRQAIKYYSQAEPLVKSKGDNEVLFSAVVDKGKAYEQLNILDSAFSYTQEGLAMLFRMSHGANDRSGGLQADMGIIYSKMGNEKLAEDYFRLSFQSNEKAKEPRLLARSYTEFAEHFDRYHKQDSAVYYATKGLLMDQKYGFLVQQLAASTLLSKLFTQENRIDSAFKYQQLMIETKDNVFSREKTNRLQTLEFNEDLRQQEKEKMERNAQEERAHNLQYAAIVLGLVGFVIVFFLFSNSVMGNQKLIRFLGVISLLIAFEFLNLLLHPWLGAVTHHSPVLMLLAMVAVAALLVPLHHKTEHWITHKMVEKNNRIRLAAAKRTIQQLEGSTETTVTPHGSGAE